MTDGQNGNGNGGGTAVGKLIDGLTGPRAAMLLLALVLYGLYLVATDISEKTTKSYEKISDGNAALVEKINKGNNETLAAAEARHEKERENIRTEAKEDKTQFRESVKEFTKTTQETQRTLDKMSTQIDSSIIKNRSDK